MGATGLSPFILIVLAAFFAGPAHADSPQLAALVVPACAPPSLATALRAELAADGVQTVVYPSGTAIKDPKLPVLTVVLRCDKPTFLVTRIFAPKTGLSTERRITVANTSMSTQYRLAALTLAELLREKWPELSGQVVPKPEQKPTSSAPFLVQVSGLVHSFPQYGPTLFGAAVGVGRSWLRGELALAGGRTSVDLGEIRTQLATASVDAIFYESAFGRWRFEFFVRGSVGWVWATGESDVADVADAGGLFAGLAAGSSIIWAATDALELGLDLAPGFSRGLRLKADEAVVSEIGGANILSHLGLRYRF